jgi:peptidoglycan/xylan/chitin deacetylase (PgdA/CDA1 family)
VIAGIKSKKNSVVLQHDIKEYSVDAVEKIIIWGLENGYVFLPLDEYAPGCHHKIFN